jgi:hypothetical protein
MKKCKLCGIIKEYTEFIKNKKCKNGVGYCCYSCYNKKYYSREKNREYVINNLDKIRKYQAEYRLKMGMKTRIPKDYTIIRKVRPRIIRDKMGFSGATIYRYGYELLKELKNTRIWECSWCKSGTDLTIHHKDQNGINLLKRGLKMNNNIDNLEVVCRSCHGEYHTKQRHQNA